jgi:hypothetical protein
VVRCQPNFRSQLQRHLFREDFPGLMSLLHSRLSSLAEYFTEWVHLCSVESISGSSTMPSTLPRAWLKEISQIPIGRRTGTLTCDPHLLFLLMRCKKGGQ